MYKLFHFLNFIHNVFPHLHWTYVNISLKSFNIFHIFNLFHSKFIFQRKFFQLLQRLKEKCVWFVELKWILPSSKRKTMRKNVYLLLWNMKCGIFHRKIIILSLFSFVCFSVELFINWYAQSIKCSFIQSKSLNYYLSLWFYLLPPCFDDKLIANFYQFVNI